MLCSAIVDLPERIDEYIYAFIVKLIAAAFDHEH